MRRIIALVNLVDGDRNYRPGDVVLGGQLEAHADYYAGLGQLRIEDAPVAESGYKPVTAAQLQAVDYSAMTVMELRTEAQARGVVGYNTMRKAELVEALGGVH